MGNSRYFCLAVRDEQRNICLELHFRDSEHRPANHLLSVECIHFPKHLKIYVCSCSFSSIFTGKYSESIYSTMCMFNQQACFCNYEYTLLADISLCDKDLLRSVGGASEWPTRRTMRRDSGKFPPYNLSLKRPLIWSRVENYCWWQSFECVFCVWLSNCERFWETYIYIHIYI